MFKALTLSAARLFARDFLALPLLLTAALPGLAQYQTHVQKDDKKKPDEPRAISILEWVGDPAKPVAGRIVPLSVFINGSYVDGGLYLAQPAPLTVETDTLYELQQAGIPKGTFYVAGGQEIGGAWFGYGKWKPLDAPKAPKKLAPSKVPPKVVQDNDPDRPHFKGAGPSSGGATTGSTQTGSTPPPVDDPDKPTLHRKSTSSDSSQTPTGGTSSGSGSTGTSPQPDDPDKPSLHRRDSSSQTASGAGTAPDDPDRPHLRKKSASAAADDDGSPVSSVNEGDPDRPKLSHGKPATAQVQMEASTLTAVPPNLQQMTAISDPAYREEHPFAYPWPEPAQAATMQAAIEQLAIKAALVDRAASASSFGPGSTAASPAKPPVRTTAPRSTLRHAVPMKPPPVVLSEKDFRTYELSYNGGATIVFTAKATIGPNNAGVTQEKFVTLIAQPDFNGDPQPRFQSVTDEKHLDITPRMKLIDAVDTDGDNRAELIFELMRTSDRQFAIYRVKGLTAEQAFATESLPYVTPSHTVAETKPN